jgi:mono/diheme cytochrome c family protein
MMNEPKDPFRLSPRSVFLWGSALVALLIALVFLYVPAAPQTRGIPASHQTYGSDLPPEDSGNGGQPSSDQGSSLAASATAEQRYQTFCSQCHGKKGDGDAPLARMMSTKPPNLIEGPFRFQRTAEAVAALIRNGAGAMPGFKDEIGEAEALDLAEYVLGLSDPKREDATESSAAEESAGEESAGEESPSGQGKGQEGSEP